MLRWARGFAFGKSFELLIERTNILFGLFPRLCKVHFLRKAAAGAVCSEWLLSALSRHTASTPMADCGRSLQVQSNITSILKAVTQPGIPVSDSSMTGLSHEQTRKEQHITSC